MAGFFYKQNKMAKYKVISLSVGGKGNKIFKNGDIVVSDNFIDAKALVKGGFLEEILEVKKEASKQENKKSGKKK